MEKYFCPICGCELKQGQYEFDGDTADLHVVYCSECGESDGMKVHDSMVAAEKFCRDTIDDFESRYDAAIDVEVKTSCSLQDADPQFYSEIADKLNEWSEEHECDKFTPEDIF